jgi:hypothetical protein
LQDGYPANGTSKLLFITGNCIPMYMASYPRKIFVPNVCSMTEKSASQTYKTIVLPSDKYVQSRAIRKHMFIPTSKSHVKVFRTLKMARSIYGTCSN